MPIVRHRSPVVGCVRHYESCLTGKFGNEACSMNRVVDDDLKLHGVWSSLRSGFEHPRWDQLGFIASSLCALHCLCLPWLVIAMPFISRTVVADPFVERVFVILSICLAMACAIVGIKKTGRWWPLFLVFAGAAALLWVHATAPPRCCAREIEWIQAIGSGFGGGLLAASHFFRIGLGGLCHGTAVCRGEKCRCPEG